VKVQCFLCKCYLNNFFLRLPTSLIEGSGAVLMMGFSKMSNPQNKVHNESKFSYDESDRRNSQIMDFSAQHLKRMYCDAYFFGKRVVFGSSAEQVADAGERSYEWPKNRIHSKARDTHTSLNLRFPVPDDKVRWETAWDSNIPPKKNVISVNSEYHDQSTYQPFFATEKDEQHYSDRVSTTHNPCGRCYMPFFLFCLF
jgi:hypothetical protein